MNFIRLILLMSLFAFFRAAVAGEPALKKVSYRGGVVEFSIPNTWKEEYVAEGGGVFYLDSPDSGTLRLDVITARPPGPMTASTTLETIRSLESARGRPIEVLTDGNALVKFFERRAESGQDLYLIYWIIGSRAGADHVRIAIFSYTLLKGQEEDERFKREIALLDSEIRKARFARELGYTEPSR
jgi:hypothetical protein